MIATLLLLAAAQQYDHGNPTADEQLVLEIINRARANPSAEETRLKSIGAYGLPMSWTIDENDPNPPFTVVVRPPLAFNAVLQGIARTHSKDMHDRGFFAHTNPDGKDPFDRMADAGYVYSRAGENIAARSPLGTGPASLLEDDLMIDGGYPGRGHRRALLDITASSPFREIGIGYWSQAPVPGGWAHLLTQDFGRAGGPFLTGIVFWDLDNDGFYDPGEGLGGVTITHTASGTFAITSSSGGYAIPVPTVGSTTVTATGINLPGGSMVTPAPVALGSENVRVEFRVLMSAAPDGDGDGLPDFWETNYPASAVETSDQDTDGFSSLLEFQGGSDPTSNASLPVPQPPPPAPPPGAPPPPPPGGGGSSGGGGGGCGALGIGVLLPVLLGAWRRRRR